MSNERPAAPEADSLVLLVAGFFCLLALGLAAFEYRSAHTISLALGAVRKENVAALARLNALRHQGQTDLKRAIEIQAALARVEKPAVPLPSATEEERLGAGQRFLAVHPEAQKLLDLVRKSLADSWPRTYGRGAGFTEDQIDQYAALFLRQRNVGWSGDDVEFPSLGDLSAHQVQTVLLTALVGDAAFARYRSYISDGAARDLAAKVVLAANGTGSPLTADQSKSLLQIFTEVTSSPAASGVDWNAASERAGQILSESQMTALNAVKSETLIQAEGQRFLSAYLTAAQVPKP